MKSLFTVYLFALVFLFGCGAQVTPGRLSTSIGSENKLPLHDIALMLTNRYVNSKCKITDVKQTTGSEGKKLTFNLRYNNQPAKAFSLSETPEKTSSWQVDSGTAGFSYWRFSYITSDPASQTNLKSLSMTANEDLKKFEVFNLTPLKSQSSIDCAAN